MDNKLQLKCLVLGSAGAGKTSLLRRYHYGTFEIHHHRGNDCDDVFTRSDTRNPTSTLGADYYIQKISNPLFVKERAANTHNDETPSSCTASAAAESHSQLFVQIWDTAGKERLKPQRYPAQYDKKSNFYQFLSIRLSPNTSNNNSSNYEHRYNNWTGTTNTNNNETFTDRHRDNEERKGKEVRNSSISQHKHGGPLHNHRHNSTKNYSNEPREDALYRNVDACMFVYDSTSSVSFLHLMQLHSEWVQRLNRWEREDEIECSDRRTAHIHAAGSRRRKNIPFIVLANKIDLLEKSELLRSSNVGPKRRSVMGFREGESYKGKDLVYEFAVENTKQIPNHSSSLKRRSSTNKRLTYSLKETSWSNDRIYLRALQLTEDQLPANRLLILLWCQRNGIPHFEASALDGRGVNEAMEHLIMVGIEELQLREKEAEKLAATHYGCSYDSISNLLNIDGATTSTALHYTNGHGAREGNMDDGNNNAPLRNTATSDCEDYEDYIAPPETVACVDPTQYYFLYQPRQDEPLDLFARYSANTKKTYVSSCFCKCC